MPSSEQENLSGGGGGGGEPAPLCKPLPAAPVAPFRFRAPRALIDWNALRALDVGAVVRDTDIDALEGVLEAVASGDLEAEDPRALPFADLAKLFRAAQLTVGYLLHVQDRLATDACAAKSELGRLQQREQVLGLKVKELREELAGSRKDGCRLKRALKTVENLALTRQPPAEAPRVVERVIEVANPAATRRAERAEAETAQLAQERTALQRDNSKLVEALAAATSSTATAIEAARQEEREVAAARLQAAVEEERRRHTLPCCKAAKLSVVVAGEDSPSLLAKLTAAQRREREAERRAETADAELARAAKAAAAPSSEARRLRAALEASQAEADVLRSRLGARERQLSPTRMPVGRQMGSGLAADLEDVDGDRAQQLEVQMAALQEELAAADAARSQLAARCTQLEQQLQQLRQQGGGGSAPAAQQAAEAEVWQQEVARLQGEKAVLKEECRRLRQEAAQSSAEIEHLTQRLQQLAGGSSSHQTASPSKAHRAQEQHARQQAEQQQEVGASGIGSPIKEPAGASTAAAVGARDSPPPAAVQRPSSRPCSAPSAQGQRPGSALGRSAPALPARHVAASPSEADKRQFRREMQHTLHTAERPGVVSRFPHSLGSFLAIRGDLKGELEAELAAELASYGLDPAADGLTNAQCAGAMAELERRRAEARRCMSQADRQRMDYMRSTAEWHTQRMAEQAMGQRAASPVKRPGLVQAPGLRPIRTLSGDATTSPRRRGFVEQVLDQVGDSEAIYSPLARGASVLSDRGYLEEGAGTPRSTAAAWPMVSDEAGTPCSPWLVTHNNVLFAAPQSLNGSPLAAGDASSPTRRSHAVRSVQFGDSWGGGDAVPAQRVGRRPSFTSYTNGAPSPGSRRVPRAAEEIQPAAESEAIHVWDSRDQDTGEASPVRPAVRRMPRQQGCILSHLS